MTDLDLTKLREIAEAATDGPWNLHTLRTDETHDIRGTIDDEANIVIYAECEDADAHHIAAFDPPTVLELLDIIERLWGQVEAIKALHRVVEVEPSDTICAECSYRLPNGKYFGQIIEHPCPTMQALSDGDSDG